MTRSLKNLCKTPVILASFLMALAFALFIPAANAQTLYGSLDGTVTDPNGAGIPAAKVDAVEMHKGIHMDATTDSSGLYRISDVLPGLWKITVTASGFNTTETDNIVIDANNAVRMDEKLAIASNNTNVTVTTAPPELQTDRADVHVDISTTELQELPAISSEGKNFQALLRIVPGSTIPLESNSAAGNPARAMTSNVNGQSTQGNSTRIDGMLDAYPWLPNNVAYVPPEDALETVNIATNSFDAEQGTANGAAVNVQVKSGTNKFHGDAHEFHTDDRLKALNYFNVPAAYQFPKLVFNQFGGAVGGPILHDKLFFFGDYEGTRQIQESASGTPQTVPFGGLAYATAKQNGFFDFRGFQIANSSTGNLVDKPGNPVHIYDPNTGNANGSGRQPISCNGVIDTICFGRADPAALNMASLVPAPTPTLATLNANNYLDRATGYFNRDSYDTKINYVPSQKSTVFAHFSLSNGKIFDPPTLGPAEGSATNGGQLGNALTRIYVAGVGGTHQFTPNLLLDGVAGFTRQHLQAKALDIAADGAYGLNTLHIPGTNNSQAPNDQLYWGLPAFSFTGFSTLGNSNTANPFEFRDNQYIAAGNLSWLKGHHQFRGGFEWDHVQLNHFQPQGSFQTARGIFQNTGVVTEQVTCPNATTVSGCTATDAPLNLEYNSYADFLLGLPYQTGKAILSNNPVALRWNIWSAYVRDIFQVTPRLSIDYGVRWEYYPMAYADHGRGARVLNPSTMQVIIGGVNGVPKNDGVQTGWGQILPRLGIDYHVYPKTVLRAGFGISADSNNWRYLRNDYPADILTQWNGTATGGPTSSSQYSPGASLTGANASGPYSYLPTGIVLATIPDTSSGSIPLPNGISTGTVGFYPTFRRGYIYGYNATVEQQFGKFVADISYVGAREIRPIINLNLQSAPAGGGTAGELLNAKFGKSWGTITSDVPLGNTYYDGLQTKLSRRFSNGSSLGVLYSWSKSEDIEDNEELSSPLWNYPAYFSRNKALSGFDRDYNFEAYWVSNLPFGKGQRWATSGFASALAGGWSLSGVLSRLSGTPFTVTDNGTDSTNLNSPGNQQTPNIVAPINVTKGKPYATSGNCSNLQSAPNLGCLYFDPRSFAGVPSTTPTVFGNAGRNIIRGPGYFDLDANLFRNFKITEFLTFQFEADCFGVTNTPHFANPDSNLTDANFGKVTGEVFGANSSLGGSGGERQWWFAGKFVF
jgi:hypothetical protein